MFAEEQPTLRPTAAPATSMTRASTSRSAHCRTIHARLSNMRHAGMLNVAYVDFADPSLCRAVIEAHP
jgi:prepilin-type processing-associated H-X9-DG protein